MDCTEAMARWVASQQEASLPLPQNSTCRAAVVTLVSLGSICELSGVQRSELGRAHYHRENCATCQAYMGKQAKLAMVERHIAGCAGCQMTRHQLVLEAAIVVTCQNVMSLWHEAGKGSRTAEQQRKFNVAEAHFSGCPSCATRRDNLLGLAKEKAKEPTGSHSLPSFAPRRRSEEPRATRSSSF